MDINPLINSVQPIQRVHRFIVREKQFNIPVPFKEYGNMSETDILIDELNYCIEQLHNLARTKTVLDLPVSPDLHDGHKS